MPLEDMMTAPRTLVVYKSIHHQNTAHVAGVIANILHADVCCPDDVAPEKLLDYDLIGFGSGIYFGRFHPSLLQWIDHAPDVSLVHRKAFVFSTEGLPSLGWFWHRSLKSRLLRKGFDIVGEFHCGGFDTVGPLILLGGLNRRHPDNRDLENAAAFARELLVKLSGVETAHIA
jgi:flavodoxin